MIDCKAMKEKIREERERENERVVDIICRR